MYNELFGSNPKAADILKALGLTTDDFYRYRDAFINQGEICVYTRGGGLNRECYGYQFDRCKDAEDDKHDAGCVVSIQKRLRNHPLYINDLDDDFDGTYCTFRFKAPSEEVLALRSDETRGENAWPLLFEELEKIIGRRS